MYNSHFARTGRLKTWEKFFNWFVMGVGILGSLLANISAVKGVIDEF